MLIKGRVWGKKPKELKANSESANFLTEYKTNDHE